MQDAIQIPSKILACKDLLTTEDMMSLLDCGRTTIHNHLKAGVLPIRPFKVANRCYWRADAVNAWLASLAAAGEIECNRDSEKESLL